MTTATETAGLVGADVDRVDGPSKVTGAARYPADFGFENLAHAVLVQSTVAAGRIRRMATAAAEAAPGVLTVITHRNAPRLARAPGGLGIGPPPPLQDDRVVHHGQHIAVVVAQTLEQAAAAARLVESDYETAEPLLDLDDPRAERVDNAAGRDVSRGDVAAGLAAAEVIVAATYTTPVQTNNPTALEDDYAESLTRATAVLYDCPNLSGRTRQVRLNVACPTWMRGPGEAPGVFALECALDELACELGLDPVELRLRNYAEVHPQTGRPWSSKALRACYERGAERFGWARRTPEPRSMRNGRFLVGYGMASAYYGYVQAPCQARASVGLDGVAVVRSAATDIGPGTYTVMTQVAADALGLPLDRVRFELGDSTMPPPRSATTWSRSTPTSRTST